ncbi:MAG: NAD-dependent DNA ligase LigA [Candidatus Omnitrophica bacterium]|nr:NAD-dependent DNA ligase LigA [Candidatus Omnitrophota bacterium]
MARDYTRNPKTEFKPVSSISKREAREQINALKEGINYHDYQYYLKASPKISDAVYDKLFRRLQELEKKFPQYRTPDSPTRRVGAPPVDKLKKRRHTALMLSLNAVLPEEDVRDYHRFVRRNLDAKYVVYTAEPKFDGLSVEIVYKKGSFFYGATRGDGETGEDISENVKTIRSVPLKLRGRGVPPLLAVRGEIYMSRGGFRRLNKERIQEGENPFANPRNAAAGLMRQLDSRKVSGKPFDVVFYEILKIEGKEFDTHWDELGTFPKWGLKTDSHNQRCRTLEEVIKYHHQMEARRDDIDYEIDGIVIKLDRYRERARLGTRQRNPRWALAWKFQPRQEVTELTDIIVQVGRTGMLTPVALLQPVDVGGVTVSRATLHNEEEVRKKELMPGDKVRVARAGDVIPEVVKRVRKGKKKKRKKFSMPGRCPSCGSEVTKEGACYFCSAGLSCPAQQRGQLFHYASREAMDISGLGERTIRQMIREGMVHDVADLYTLRPEDFARLEGFAEKSARQLYEAVQSSKEVRLDRFLYALGIRHVGAHVARVLAQKFGRLEAIESVKEAELIDIEEIGPEIARSVHQFFAREENQKVLRKLRMQGMKVRPMPRKKSRALEGKTFVFTGELKDFTREEAKEAVEFRGGRASSTVSGNTDYVVAGENPGSKRGQAKKRKVKILNERQFKKMLS